MTDTTDSKPPPPPPPPPPKVTGGGGSTTEPDLSMGDGSDDKFNAQTELYKQRYDHRRWLFVSALIASSVMGCFFIWFVHSVLCWTWAHPDKAFDWHILMLGSAIIVPPTLVVWNLMKQVFRSDGKLENGHNHDGSSGILWSDVLKEAIDVARDFLAKKKAD